MKNDRVYHTITVLYARLNEARYERLARLQSFPVTLSNTTSITVISVTCSFYCISLNSFSVLCGVEHRLESGIAARGSGRYDSAR